MATAFVPEGSPLDDYFQVEAEGSMSSVPVPSTSDTPSSSPSPASSPDSRPRHGNLSPPHKRSYPMFNGTPTKITSRHPSPLGLGLSSKGSLTGNLRDDVFGERFKYAICSSGILEKDYIPGLGTLASDGVNYHNPQHRLAEVATMVKPTEPSRRAFAFAALGTRRWDIGVAGLALVYGVYQLAGFTWLLAFMGSAVAVGGAGAAKILASNQTTPVNSAPPTPHKRKAASPTVSPAKTEAMDRTVGFLDASGRLDNAIERALSILQPFPPASERHHDLRLTLHRLTNDMSDHLATANSSLTDLVDRDELSVLSDMYDIPSTAQSASRRPGRFIDDDDDFVFNMTESWKTSSVPSPRQPRLTLSPQAPAYDTFPMSQSQSLPTAKRAVARHLSPMPSSSPLARLSESSSPKDRFTSLPNRTPRFSKRSSWGPDMSPAKLDGLAPAPTIRPRRMSRSSVERKITEGEGELETNLNGESIRNSWSEHQSFAFGRPISPSPLALKSYTPRRSPLAEVTQSEQVNAPGHSRTLSHSANPPQTPKTAHPKRLSLQSMPYYPPFVEETQDGAGGLSRTRSMPQSDIQTLRSRYATGSRHSLHTTSHSPLPQESPDYASLHAVLTSPTPPPPLPIRRMVSVSPLTLHSLKASCLGIHLRRRRVACCLLGLRFDISKTEYWREVGGIVKVLSVDTEVELAKLDDAIANALKESERTESAYDHRVPWARMETEPSLTSSTSTPPLDFAPRTSDEVLLKERIEGLRKTLEKTWVDLAVVQQAIDPGELDEKWGAVRGDLGEMVREWERGKEAVGRITGGALGASRVSASSTSSHPVLQSIEERTPPLPEFIKQWQDDDDSFETDAVPASLDSQDDDQDSPLHQRGLDAMMEDLPRPGVDVVFEADLAAAAPVRERSTLGREERIALAKAARAEGLTVAELLKRQAGQVVVKNGDKDVLEHGGMVVDELKSMIGMIRARKGVNDQETE